MARGKYRPSRELVLSVLGDHKPKSSRQVIAATGLSRSSVHNALRLCWKRGLVLRTKKPIYHRERVFKGRGGVTQNTRPYHLYLLKPEGKESVSVGGRLFVSYEGKYLDPRGGGGVSKAQRVLDFVQEHRDRSFFSTEHTPTSVLFKSSPFLNKNACIYLTS